MNARLLATLVAAGAVAVSAAPAGAAPKTMKGSYPVTAPVPFPMTTDVPTMYGCIDGQESVSKVSKDVTLPDAGLLKVELAYTGDWDLYVLDKTGAILAAAETSETGNTSAAKEKLSWKKGKKGQVVTLVACNWMGTADATVSYTYTYGK
ncbi:MAG TPA: hypothetical protein VF519_01280 [Mycobacteriales bacterium]|jgi:hypothetical protein